jgi:hypothetical protein
MNAVRQEKEMTLDSESHGVENTPGRGTTGLGKILGFALLGLMLAALVLAALAPTILSTSFGRGLAVSAVNDSIHGSIQLENIELNWLSGQRIERLVLLDPQGRQVLRLDELTTELTLLQALRRELALGQTVVRGLTGNIIVDETGDNNLNQALAPTSAEEKATGPLPLPLTANLDLSAARFNVTAPGMEPVAVDNLTAALRLVSPGEPATFELRGQSRQGEMTGQFRIAGQARGFLDAKGNLDLDKAEGGLSADVTDLPVDGIDRMLGLKGLLSAALGERVSIRVDASGTAESQDIAASASAPNAEAALSGRVADGRFELTRSASMQLSITPRLFSQLVGPSRDGAELRLDEAFPLALTAESIGFPVTGFDPGAISFEVGLTAATPIRMSGSPEPGELVIRDLKAEVASTRLADGLGFSLGGTTRTRDRSGKLSARVDVADLFDTAGEWQPDKLRMDTDFALSGIPTVLIDQLTGQGGLLTDLLGEKIDMTLRAQSSGADQIDGALSIDAGPLRAEKVSFQVRDRVMLTQPAVFHYALQPRMLQRLAGAEAGVTMKRPALVEISINRLEAPRPRAGAALFQPEKTVLQASLNSEPLELSGGPDWGEVRVEKLNVNVAADPLSELRIMGSAALMQLTPGPLSDINAGSLLVRFDGVSALDSNDRMKSVDGRVQLTSEGLNGEATFSLDPAITTAVLKEPAKLNVLLTPSLLNRLGFAAPGQPTLAGPTPLVIELAQLKLPLAPFSPQALQMSMSLAAKEFVLAGDKSLEGAALRDAMLGIDFNGGQGTAALKLDAATVLSGERQTGKLAVDAKLTQVLRDGEFDLTSAIIDGNVRFDRLPTALIELISRQRGLAALVGESINLDSRVKTGGGTKVTGSVDLKASSTNLTVDAGLKLGDEITLGRPVKASLTLTPAGIQALGGDAPAGQNKATTGYELAGEAVLSAIITTLRWPIATPADGRVFDPSRAALEGAVKIPALSLRDRASGQILVVEKLQAMLKAARFDQPMDVELSGILRRASDQTQDAGGRLGVKSRVSELFDETGGFKSEGVSVSMDGMLQKVPVALLDQLLSSDGLTTATLGTSADVTFTADLERMTGPVTLMLRADRANFDVKTQLRQDGLVLTAPLVAELEVTQELGKQVLSNIHPIFETTQSADRPIRLEIPPEGVFIPTRAFDTSKVIIPQARIDFGKIILKSGWLLKGIVGLAQQFGAIKEAEREQWSAWFTPAVLEFRDGRINYTRRLDVLLDQRFHLATWGTADIVGNRVGLTLALMPETLEKVFRLPVAAGDALHIPITGALDSPSVDYSKAALDLGRLRAQKRLVEKDPLTGALVGAVTGRVAGTGGSIPRASVDPLPWGALPEPEVTEPTRQPAPKSAEPEPSAPKSTKEQAIESLIDLLRKPK